MAGYSSIVTTPLKQTERISRSLGIYAGKCNIDNYNTTLLEITGITRYFKTGGVSGFTGGIIAVVADQVSENGFLAQWDYTTGAFKCFAPLVGTTLQITVVTSAASGLFMELNSSAGTIVCSGANGTGTFDIPLGESPATEANTDDDVGEISFYAIGFI